MSSQSQSSKQLYESPMSTFSRSPFRWTCVIGQENGAIVATEALVTDPDFGPKLRFAAKVMGLPIELLGYRDGRPQRWADIQRMVSGPPMRRRLSLEESHAD